MHRRRSLAHGNCAETLTNFVNRGTNTTATYDDDSEVDCKVKTDFPSCLAELILLADSLKVGLHRSMP
jgi:hypothetical protein